MGAVLRKVLAVGRALRPSAVRQGWQASMSSLENGGRLSEEQLAGFTPEQRAQYEAAYAEAQRAVQRSADDAVERDLGRRALLGAAGEFVHGPVLDRERMTDLRLSAQWAATRADLRDTLSNPFGKRSVPPPAAPVSPDRAVQARHERGMRDEARTPYLADDPPAVVTTLVATSPERPVEELAAWLGSSGLAGRPDLVYGVHRVPDHLPGTLRYGRPTIVEWAVVHAVPDPTPLPPAPPATVAWFDARERWVARRAGEPAIIDEDLGVAYLAGAGVGPEDCLGLARLPRVAASTGDDLASGYALIGAEGLLVLTPAGRADGMLERMRAARPLPVPPPDGVHVEQLNWGAIRQAVCPRSDRLPPVPSPFPHLPLTGEELLRAYLQVVGVRPADCYSAQVTVGSPASLHPESVHVRTSGAEAEPAADGQVRPRLRGGTRVVVVHRDRPEYAAGRERWTAYEHEVLEARLHRGFETRPPVEGPGRLDRGTLGALVRTAERMGDLVDGYGGGDPLGDVPAYRYCWPPVE